MKRFVPRAGVVLCAMALGAWEAAYPRNRQIARKTSGAIPKLDRGPTLEGVDANGNGIRDDVDAFIDSDYSTERSGALRASWRRTFRGQSWWTRRIATR